MAQVLHMCGICYRFKILPGPGSLLEQDSFLMWLLTMYLDAVEEREKLEAKRVEADARRQKAATGRRG